MSVDAAGTSACASQERAVTIIRGKIAGIHHGTHEKEAVPGCPETVIWRKHAGRTKTETGQLHSQSGRRPAKPQETLLLRGFLGASLNLIPHGFTRIRRWKTTSMWARATSFIQSRYLRTSPHWEGRTSGSRKTQRCCMERPAPSVRRPSFWRGRSRQRQSGERPSRPDRLRGTPSHH